MTREDRFDEARRVLAVNGYTCSGLDGLRFTATHESGYILEVELRPNVLIKQDNMYTGLYMCFPIRGDHYLLPHDTLVEIACETTNWLNTRSWGNGLYTSSNPNALMCQSLAAFRLESPDSDQFFSHSARPEPAYIETHQGATMNSMLGNRWTRDQDLAVFYIRHHRLSQYIPALADAMNRTEGAIWGRMATYDYLDPSARHFGRGNPTRLTRSVWAEYERNPHGVLSEAYEAFYNLVGPTDSSIEIDSPMELDRNSYYEVSPGWRRGREEELLAAIFDRDARCPDTSTVGRRSSETEEPSATVPASPSQHNATPLHEAARAGHTDIVRTLVAAGADIHALDENGHTPLHVAARMGHAGIVQLLIDAGSNVNPRTGRGNTPLHSAIAEGDTDRARELISLGADVNAQDENGRTPLHEAIDSYEIGLARSLISAGVDVNVQDEDENTPLRQAIHSNQTEFARDLILAGAEVNPLDIFDSISMQHEIRYTEAMKQARALQSKGITPLQYAVRHSTMEMVQMLISLGADSNSRDELGRTSLHHAVLYNRIELVDLLVLRGADIDASDEKYITPLRQAVNSNQTALSRLLVSLGADVNAADMFGGTPLHEAVRNNHAEMVQALISAGADLNGCGFLGSPLHHAARYIRTDMMRTLISLGANVNTPDQSGKTPLHEAIDSRWVIPELHFDRLGIDIDFRNTTVQTLISTGADVNSSDISGSTPMHRAVGTNQIDIVRTLISAGADINVMTMDDIAPLHQAALENNTEMVLYLVSAGADVNIVGRWGQTPLHMASSLGNTEAAQALIFAAGAVVEVPSESGCTPLHQAAFSGHAETVEMLLSSGADPNARDENGQTPLDLTDIHNHEEVARILRDTSQF